MVWHPFTITEEPPIPIVRGKGVYLYGEDGRRYIDAISSWWVNLHGHAHPYIIEKIHAQAKELEHVIFAGFTHAPAAGLASRLLSYLPGGMSKVFYSDNGSTAVEVALKMALQYWYNQGAPKSRIISFKHGYHGDTFGAMSAAGKNAFNRPFWSHLFEVVSIEPPLAGLEDVSEQCLIQHLQRGDVACFLFEPLILAAGGMIMYPPHGLDRLLQRCKEYRVLTIADEVMTGFGRTGTLFACDQLVEKPDIICLSKGITGGFLPLGATACTEEVYKAFTKTGNPGTGNSGTGNSFLHGHSYTANPLACVASLASLDLLLEEECTHQRQTIQALHQAFCHTWRDHPRLARLSSLGTCLALEFKVDNGSYFHPIRNRLYKFFLERGILLRPLGNVLYVLPPYCIQEAELSYIYDKIGESL